MKRLALVPYTFVLLNWAAVAGLVHFLRGSSDIWQPGVDSSPGMVPDVNYEKAKADIERGQRPAA